MKGRFTRIVMWVMLIAGTLVLGSPFPGYWQNGSGAAVHFQPVNWPADAASPALCGDTCGDWKPYTRFGRSITDPRTQDPSNGGTAPQNYVNVSSSCTDKSKPSIYYYLYKATNPANDVVMFRWRVEQPAHNYATGPSAGNYGSANPWSSAQWTVLFNVDGSGYRSLAAHLNGSSGSPSEPIDMLAGIWSSTNNQSIDYSDPSVHLLAHNPTAFIGPANKLMNFHSSLSPDENWLNGAAETVWDYGTTRATVVSTSPCTEYFIDYQIPVAMLDAAGVGGPSLTRDTPISMLFCTANSLSNPFQKDCAINRQWTADVAAPAPFGDYLSFNKDTPYQQPIVSSVTATPPSSCPGSYTLTATIQDALALQSGVVVPTVKSVQFYYWYDRNGDGAATAADTGSAWTRISATATLTPQTLNSWSASWDATSLSKGKYLIGVQAVDDATLLDDNMTATGVDNRTFSYLTGSTDNKIYIDGAWISGQQAAFPTHSPSQTPSSSENWYGNPDVTGTQVAVVGTAINACGVAPTLTLSATPGSVATGGTVSYTLTLTNPSANTSAITVNSVGDVLPTGFTYTNGSSSGSGGLPSANPSISGQQLTWTLGSPLTLAAGSSATLSFSATASSAAGTYSSTATADTSFGSLTSSPASVAVDSARVSLTMTPSAYSIAADGTTALIYTLRYANDSSVSVTGASISDTLPADVTYVSCSGGTCGNSAGVVSWSLGTVGPGVSGTVTLTITVPSNYSSFSLANSATLSVTAPDSSTVTATASTTVAVTGVSLPGTPAFTLTKTTSAASVAPGGTVTYTLTYNNYGSASASSVVLTDTLPAGMTFSSCSNSCSNGSGTITWNIGTVAAGGSSSRTVTVTADNPFTATNPATNNASITWSGGGPVTAQVDVGVTGQSCSTYYYKNTTANVGFDGTKRIANVSPVPVAGDTGTTVSATAPVSGSAFLEVLRFYQDPQTPNDVPFNGNITSSVYIDRANGQGLNIRTTIYDYNSSTGAATQLAQSTKLFSGSLKGLLTDTITPSGTLAKGHRLLWVYDARSNHASQTVQVEFQFGGTVTNGISGGTTFANSNAAYCVTPPASLTLTNQASVASITEATTPTITYTLNYANTGSASATNTTLVGALPTGFTGCQYSTNGSTWSSCSSTGSSPPSHSFSLGTVTGGTSGTVYVRGTVPSGTTGGSTLTSTSTLTSDQTTSLNASASTAVASASGGGTPALSLTLAANRSSAAPGASVVYTLTVINTGSAAATNVVVSNTVPSTAYYTYSSCTGSCGVSGSTMTWPTIASLAAGASQSVTYTMAVGTSGLPSGVTTISDNAAASGDSALSATSNTVAVTITGNPSLVLLNNPTPNSGLHPGDTVTYTLTIANAGAADAEAVTVVNPIPANTSYGGTINATQGSASFDTVGNRVVYDVGTMAYGASVTLTFTARINYPLPSGTTTTTITSTATADASNASQLVTSASVSATATPVLAISKTAPTSVAYPAAVLTAAASGTVLFVDRTDHLQVNQLIKVGSQVARIVSLSARSILVDSSITASSGASVNGAMPITIAYRNTGDADATSVSVRETLAAGFGYYASTPTATSVPLAGNNGDVDWTIGTLAAGASSTLQVLAFPTGVTGSFTNTSLITASNANSATASAITTIGGLSILKSSSTAVISAGSAATYTIVVTNSLGSPITPVSITDVLPEGFSYYANSALVGGVAIEPTFDVADTGQTQPIWAGLNIPATGSLSIQFQALVSASAGAGTYQNEVLATAPAGIGVQGFDPLLTTAEDVRVLAAASGMVKGYVFSRASGNALNFDPLMDTPLTGVRVEIHKSGADCNNPVGGNCMVVYTDNNGYFEQAMPAEAWIVSVIQNTGDLPGSWYQLAGTNNNTVNVPNQSVVWDYNGFVASAPTHTVTATAGANGSISPSSRTVNDGDTTTFTVTPDSGYNIDTVTGCSGSLSGPTYTTGAINADCTVSATFALIGVTTHTVSAVAGSGGSISPASATVNDGSTTAFTVTPDTGYSITSVSGCSGSLSGSTFTTGAITSNCTVTASFSLLSYTVTATAGSGGSIGPASAAVSYGNTTAFTVTPDSGYTIASVSGCGGSLSGSTYTTAAITAACTVSASFISSSTPSHVVSTSAGSGGSISPASVVVADGSTTAFAITPSTGYHIATVSGCGGSLSGSTFTTAAITAACTVSATFSVNTYTVTASAGSGGTISPPSSSVTHGNTTAFTVTPNSGYHIATVTGCGGSLSGSTFTTAAITAACTVSATFSINTYTVTASAGSGGTISPSSSSVTHGNTTAFTVTPNSGYHVASVSGCGGNLSGSTYTTAAITAACSVSATFSINTYTVTASASSGGTISPSSTSVSHGNTTTFAVTPNSGYTIASVSGCGGSLSGSTFTTAAITAACTVSATFTVNTYTVTASAGSGGTISPSSTSVSHGNATAFTVTPNSGYHITTVTGCGGSLSGSTYTTSAVTAACTVSATFSINTYTVTASAGSGGAVSPGSASVNHGNTATFTVTPDSGYTIVSVSGCGGSLSGNTFTTAAVTSACAVSATFSNVYTVTANAGSGGTISPSSTSVTYGNTTAFTVTPNTGYHITTVTGCGGSLSGGTYTTAAITAACTVSAAFSINTYTVAASAGSGGTISPSSSSVTHGNTTTFTVTPDSGYTIASVGGCGGSLSGSTYTTAAITAACAVSASFISSSTPSHVVSTSAGSGGTISPTSTVVADGSTTAFTVTPNTGYHIAGVSGCGGSLSGSTYTTAAITAACTVNATFTVNTYTVAASAGSGGTISPFSTSVSHGNTTAFSVTPSTGYHIASVSGCGGSLSGSTFTTAAVTAACTVSATFAANTYTVTASAGSGGTISPSSASVSHGNTTAFTVTPSTGYHITSVSGCGGSLSGSTFTTAAVTAACTVSATFTANTYTVTASAGSGGTISPSSTSVSHGNTTAFTVTPNAGYHIASVSGCGGSLSGSTFTTAAVTAACTVSATFTVNTYAVTVSAGSGGTISPSNSSVTHGNTATFSVTPNSGYRIATVTGCGGSLSGSAYTTSAITAACTVSATFSINTYTVTTSAGSGGTISPSSSSVTHGNTTTFAVTPNSGYTIASVSGCGGSLSGNTFTTAAITSACAVTASFASTMHLVSTSVGTGGSISPTSVQVADGNTTALTLTPSSGYHVSAASGCGGSLSGNTYTTGNITAACTVTASFARDTYVVTATAGNGGSVSPGSMTVNRDATASFTVVPNVSHGVQSVTGCDGSLSGNTYTTAAITAACTVSASFIVNAPVFGPAPPISINARALFTDVPKDIAPSAVDENGHALTVTLVGSDKLRPGRHLLTWTATDSHGRTMTQQQQLDIWPTVSLSNDLLVGFGSTAEFRVILNGDAPVYPFTVAYTVAGDGGYGTLHTLAPGSVTFTSGTEVHIQFNALSQGASLPTKHLQVVLDPAVNIGERGELNISLLSSNAAPRVNVLVSQADRTGTLVARDDGLITLHATISDPNPLDTHVLDWTYPLAAVVQISADGRDLTLDPRSLSSGLQEFSVLATDSGTPSLSNRARVVLALRATSPALGNGDSNDNGMPDAVDGWGDSGNGIPDYLNRGTQPEVLPEDAPVTDQYLVEGDAGVHLRIGSYAQLSGGGGVRLSNATVAALMGSDVINNVGGYFDLAAVELPMAGAGVRAVIPQRQPIPNHPDYRLWDAQQQHWVSFVENGNNILSSAPGEPGYCPAPGSSAYTPGLTPGNWCVQIIVEDGGANDADRLRNGAMSISGGIAARENSVVTGASSGGGGGAMGWFVGFLSLLVMLRRSARNALQAFWMMLLLPLGAQAAEAVPAASRQCQPDATQCFYLGGSLARVHNSADAHDMDARLAAQGYVTQTSLSGQSRMGGFLFGGYRWQYVAAEIGYAHLGTMHTTVAGLTPVDEAYLRAISIAHPRSGKGPQLSALGYLPLRRNLEAYGRIGLFYWRNTLSAEGVSRYADVDGRQLDTYVGLGLQLRPVYQKWSAQVEMQRYRLDGETISSLNLGVIYRLPW